MATCIVFFKYLSKTLRRPNLRAIFALKIIYQECDCRALLEIDPLTPEFYQQRHSELDWRKPDQRYSKYLCIRTSTSLSYSIVTVENSSPMTKNDNDEAEN